MYGTIYCQEGEEDALAYAKQAAESAFITIHGKRIKVDFAPGPGPSEGINIAFSREIYAVLGPISRQVTIDCYVEFDLKHSYFNRQHAALEALPWHVIQLLIPTKKVACDTQLSRKIKKCDCLELDDKGQMQALTGILQQGSDPLIIAGPFGTGKTRVLARAAYELIMQNRSRIILICTHHQSSADTFIEYFHSLQMENQAFNRIKIVRVQIRMYRSRTKDKYPKYYCSVGEALSRNAQVIVSTLGLSHHLKIKGYISHILIDEAAQTRETEAIIPLQHATIGTKVVLAGDHCQVI